MSDRDSDRDQNNYYTSLEIPKYKHLGALHKRKFRFLRCIFEI